MVIYDSQMHKTHAYQIKTTWTGNRGTGTSDYRAYERAHEFSAPHKPVIVGSSDPAFRGDATRYNPEELLVASLSACHMLWYLHLCSENGIVVTAYADDAHGTMAETSNGSGHFTEVALHPVITIASGDGELAQRLHERAHERCYIARSVNFPVRCESEIKTNE
jgi:organic hydroperoxide reductase OsmC/OhrA